VSITALKKIFFLTKFIIHTLVFFIIQFDHSLFLQMLLFDF